MFTMRTEHRFNPSIARVASPSPFTRVAAVILFVLVQLPFMTAATAKPMTIVLIGGETRGGEIGRAHV